MGPFTMIGESCLFQALKYLFWTISLPDLLKKNIYAYSTLNFIDNAVLAIGLSAASMEVGS